MNIYINSRIMIIEEGRNVKIEIYISKSTTFVRWNSFSPFSKKKLSVFLWKLQSSIEEYKNRMRNKK